MTADPLAALHLLNSLGIAGPNIIHAEQGMWNKDAKGISIDDTWDGPGNCVCRRVWPCEAKQLGDIIDGLAAAPPADSLDVRAAIAAVSPLVNPRLSEVDWDAVAAKLAESRLPARGMAADATPRVSPASVPLAGGRGMDT